MAIIKALPAIKGSSTRSINYACHGKNQKNSPDLKACPDTAAEIAYVTNDNKVAYVSGIHCTPETAAEQFVATRQLWGKDTGAKCFHIIQSFKPGEIDPETAHKIGKKLFEKVAPGYEIVIGTHFDKAHIHNHIIINAVNKDFGYKYHSSKRQLKFIKDESNLLCKEHNLSIIEKKAPGPRTTQAEIYLKARGIIPWKDELKRFIDDALQHSRNKDQFIKYLKDKYQVEVKWQNKNASFLYPGKQKYVRGDTLGERYTISSLYMNMGVISLPKSEPAAAPAEYKKEYNGKEITELERYKQHCLKCELPIKINSLMHLLSLTS